MEYLKQYGSRKHGNGRLEHDLKCRGAQVQNCQIADRGTDDGGRSLPTDVK